MNDFVMFVSPAGIAVTAPNQRLDVVLPSGEAFSMLGIRVAGATDLLQLADQVAAITQRLSAISDDLLLSGVFTSGQIFFPAYADIVRFDDAQSSLQTAAPSITEGSRLGDAFFAGDIVIAMFGSLQVRPALSAEISVSNR